MKTLQQTLFLLAFIGFFISQGCKEDLSQCERNNLGSGNGEDYPTTDCSLSIENLTPSGAAGGTFDTQKFVNALMDSISGATGYQIAVGYKGAIIATASSGYARKKVDCVYFMSDCNIFNIASQTKSFTTAALLRLLDANGLTVDNLIGPYLPSDWVLPEYVQKLSFRHCLGHRTAVPGINSASKSSTDWSGLKASFTSPAVDTLVVDSNPDNNEYRYLNADLAIMRIIIPTLWKNLPDAPSELKNAEKVTESLSRKYYEQYLKTYIFQPVGVVDAAQVAPGNDEMTLYYKISGSEIGDDYVKDWSAHGGGGGWYMRASDIVKVIMGMWENDAILSPNNRSIMMNHPTLSWKQGFNEERNTSRGVAFGHGGDLAYKDEGHMHGAFAILPDGIYVDIMINSTFPGDVSNGSSTLFRMMCNAYLASW